jgi:hypothetical protein
MNRRQVLQSLGLLTAHSLFPTVLTTFVSSCNNPDKKQQLLEFLTNEELGTVIETIDIILPTTKTKSASQVNTHLFLDQVFAKCMTHEQQAIMRTGIASLAKGLSSASDKLKYLEEIDKKAYEDHEDAAYFKAIKQYAMIGFFTSQEGTTKAANYVKIPTEFKGDIPADPGTLNYGKTSLQFYL